LHLIAEYTSSVFFHSFVQHFIRGSATQQCPHAVASQPINWTGQSAGYSRFSTWLNVDVTRKILARTQQVTVKICTAC